jgi:hypothetical protein
MQSHQRIYDEADQGNGRADRRSIYVHEAGEDRLVLPDKHGVSEDTPHNWTAKYGDIDVSVPSVLSAGRREAQAEEAAGVTRRR